MHCPKCQVPILEKFTCCPNCGHDLSLFRSVQAMKADLAKVRSETLQVFRHLDLLEHRFSEFEGMVAGSSSSDQVAVPEKAEETTPVSFDESDLQATLGEETHTEISEQHTPKTPITLQEQYEAPSASDSGKTPQQKQQSEVLFGQKWLLIAGVVITVLGVGWFLKYSFDQNWIGPAGRVFLAYLWGMAFLGGGEFFRRKDFEHFGLSLIGGGIAMFYFATFAAFQIYDLLPQSLAFLVMVVVTALACLLSLVYDTKWLAVLGLIGGFLTPVILSTGQDNQLVLMSYMVILNVGILSIAFFKQWRLLNYLGFFFTWLLFTGWMFSYYSEQKFWLTTLFLNIFFLTYALVPFVYHLIQGHAKHLKGIRIIIPNSFLAFGYSFGMIEDHFRMEYVSIVTLFYTVIFLLMAQILYRRNREQLGAFVMLLAEAMIFLVLTIPILFSEQWITVFWAVQGVILLWAALKLGNKWLYGCFVLLLVLTLGKFFVFDYDEVFRLNLPSMFFRGGYTSLLLERYLASISVLLALFVAAFLATKSRRLFQGKDLPILWGGFTIALFIILNIEVGAFFYEYGSQARFATISVLWTLFSILMIALGFSFTVSVLRISAIGLFGITMLKVFLLDMANVSTPYRVVSFMVLGLMLIGASYLYYRFRDRILPPDEH